MKKFTQIEVSQFVYLLALHAATKASEDIIENIEVKNKDTEEKKLQFDLTIAFIFMASESVCGMAKWDKNLQTDIMDGVCDLYFKDLEEFSQDIKHAVDAAFFLRDKDEIALFCRYLPPNAKVDINNFHCQTTLSMLARLLFNKRFIEYQELWQSDMKKVVAEQSGFIPQMPHKVYEHWSGKSGEESRTFESIIFTTELFTHLSIFSLAIAKQLSEITVNNG